ncbi:hypothetical protein BCR33DRAFT_778899 [Rhizoclosmatium globosum]|uniref:Uncharacterized protein n=1 Tax=Rhizoclosmatium globosum TaxID=329046 RepID=A0A1Y2D2I0_9FUNG|nr:hypothetical protein BCR33DRAFT_778899 [Rhizoclosmatium globosum]|eukprot:ORY53501.1 hypothetical protein BCR33DRAFT_778899 [Rhizoclosmatium globosum]
MIFLAPLIVLAFSTFAFETLKPPVFAVVPVSVSKIAAANVSTTPQPISNPGVHPFLYPYDELLELFGVYLDSVHDKVPHSDIQVEYLFGSASSHGFDPVAFMVDEVLETEAFVAVMLNFDDITNPIGNGVSNFKVYNESMFDINSVRTFTIENGYIGIYFKVSVPSIWYSISIDRGEQTNTIHIDILAGAKKSPFASFDIGFGVSLNPDYAFISRTFVPAPIFVGISTDKTLWQKLSPSSPWFQVSGTPIIDLIQLPNLSFITVGIDNTLFTCPTLETCTQVPGSGSVISIDVLTDKKTFIGVGMDYQLYTRSGISGPWSLVAESGKVVDVTVLTNGVILGTTLKATLVYRNTLTSKWIEIPKSCCVSRTAALLNGGFVGVGGEYALYRRATLESDWEFLPGTGSVVSVVQVSAMPVPKLVLVGVGMDSTLWGKYSLAGSWSLLSKTKALDLVQMPDGSFVTAGLDNILYHCQTLTSCTQVVGSGAVTSIDLLSDKRTFVGVGMDGLLYTRVGIYGGWNVVWNSGTVIDITVLNSGALLGTGPDKYLYLRDKLTADWKIVKGSCCVSRTAQLPDGSILGVGGNNAIYQKKDLLYTSPWVEVPNSKAVLSIETTN